MTEAQMFGIGYWIVIAVVIGAAKLWAHVHASMRKRKLRARDARVASFSEAKAGSDTMAEDRRRAA